MTNDQIQNILAFIKSAENLKNTLRSARTSTGKSESSAEHSWRLCLLVMSFNHELDEVDISKLLKICVVHDLGEAISGDVPAPEQIEGSGRAANERRDLESMLKNLPPNVKSEILSLWDEYEQGSSMEGRLAKGFDKLETIIQHNQGNNAADFDYHFNLTYGQERMTAHPLLAEIRAIVDAETQSKIEEQNAH